MESNQCRSMYNFHECNDLHQFGLSYLILSLAYRGRGWSATQLNRHVYVIIIKLLTKLCYAGLYYILWSYHDGSCTDFSNSKFYRLLNHDYDIRMVCADCATRIFAVQQKISWAGKIYSGLFLRLLKRWVCDPLLKKYNIATCRNPCNGFDFFLPASLIESGHTVVSMPEKLPVYRFIFSEFLTQQKIAVWLDEWQFILFCNSGYPRCIKKY